MNLSPTDQARGRELITRCYPSLNSFLQGLFNEQLADCRGTWEFDDWCERLALTAQWFEDGSGRIRVARPRKRVSIQ